MRTNFPIFAAFTLLVILFVYTCTTSLPSKIDDRDFRDYPTGKTYEKTQNAKTAAFTNADKN